MYTTTITCPYCKKESEKYVGHVNRANKIGAPVYCSKTCSGLARRNNKTVDQKKTEKAEYDKVHRQKPHVKQKRSESFKRNYKPEEAAIKRKERMPYHVEYCRKPEYKAKKQKYDEQHRAQKQFGEFAEASIILRKIFSLIDNRAIKEAQGLNNKSLKRKRQWEKTRKTGSTRLL